MNADKIYVSFERGDQFYRGTLSPVSGAGDYKQESYHLMIDCFYYGHLRLLESGWVFNNQWNWNDLGKELGRQVDERLERE